ncbi:MAG TPA: hypothetical protein VIU46_01450 [Gallionellaceae bacterium]
MMIKLASANTQSNITAPNRIFSPRFKPLDAMTLPPFQSNSNFTNYKPCASMAQGLLKQCYVFLQPPAVKRETASDQD